MKPSEHEIRFSNLIESMPTEELGRELVRFTIEHDVSFEAVTGLSDFFERVAAERCAGEVATESAATVISDLERVNRSRQLSFRVDI